MCVPAELQEQVCPHCKQMMTVKISRHIGYKLVCPYCSRTNGRFQPVEDILHWLKTAWRQEHDLCDSID